MTNSKGKVVTVAGPISPSDLGITLTHEHLLIDQSFYHDLYGEPKEEYKKPYVETSVDITCLWVIHRDPYVSKDNLSILEEDLVAKELLEFKKWGGCSVVDLTNIGIGRNPVALKEISQKTGLNIIVATGYYISTSHPSSMQQRSVDDIAEEMIRELTEGIGDTGVKAGVIGEIGTSTELTKAEEKMLVAAAHAHLQTGAPINVHLANRRGSEGLKVLRILEREGIDLARTVMSHMDLKLSDLNHQIAVAEIGAYLEYDGFGEEYYIDSMNFVAPRDTERIDGLRKLIDKGFLEQILLSHDICMKMQLKRYGGQGYDHLLRNIVPMMKRSGIDDKDIEIMMVKNPSRMLTF